MKRNKVSKLQMRRLAAGVTIALLAGTCQVMADQSTNPISESEVFTADRLAQVVNKNNMPKERFKSVAAGILGYTHDKASIKTINIDMAGHDLTLDLTKVADLGTDYSAYGIKANNKTTIVREVLFFIRQIRVLWINFMLLALWSGEAAKPELST